MNEIDNPCLLLDSYKPSQPKQYPPGLKDFYAYFESRGGRFPEFVFFGLQYLLKRYLSRPVTMADVEEADALLAAHIGPGVFERELWARLVEKRGGLLPVSIRAVPEGTPMAPRNVCFTIESTDPEFAPLTNSLETLLVETWYPSTVATVSRECKKVILRYLADTGGDPAAADFMLHDFGFRGATSPESAGWGGCGHLVNFKGTDTIAALLHARRYYGEPMAGFSIPASEHSTITSWGREREVDAYRNMIRRYGHFHHYACVSDSYNVYEACKIWGTVLKAEVLAAQGTLVVRPDSGDPIEVVPRILHLLGEYFGYTTNRMGYKLLNPKVRVIQGDGINYDSLGDILWTACRANGWAAENLAFGMGAGLLQKLDRDTMSCALKCSYVETDFGPTDVFKEPATQAAKRSKRGKLKLVRAGLHGTAYATVGKADAGDDLLVEVFRDGKLLVDQTLAECRERARIA